ncbi:DNA-binding SARP family transcriptional activator [Chitinivorax tropicus]|uniref:DNA-binding SARP family transcriptional activator n=1 Tax=Chitinivorax tropicus TaxID=714531 RepID=A0A840MUE5_9PROT|nr:AAA family ATPase [Chitinivorax tropicus]MBB5020422.1 DNA-binding SARP family transcriptional activator [Chitinivorax tropicus]
MDSDQGAAFALCLHGAPCLQTSQGVVRLERKDAGMLAYLAMEHSATRARLAALFWPDTDADKARRNLRQRLLRLRRLIDLPLIDGDQVLSIHSNLQILKAGSSGDGEAHILLGAFQYEDLSEFQAWLDRVRIQQGMQAQQSIKQRMQQAESAMLLDEAIVAANQLLAIDAVDEDGYRCLIKCHYLKGDRGAALDAYRLCQVTLAKELGVAPSEETEFLRKQLQQKVVSPTVPAALPVTVLRPPQLVGRGTEWQWLLTQWQCGRIAFVHGQAGIGKSRLVHEFTNHQSAGVVAVEGRAGDAAIPYLFLSRFVRALLPLMTAPLTEGERVALSGLLSELAQPGRVAQDQDRAALIHTIEGILLGLAGQQISGLLLDDLHYADQASIEVLSALLPTTLPVRLPWLMAFREECAPAHLQRMLDDCLHAGWAASLQLGPLTLDQTTRLVESLVLPGLDLSSLMAALQQRSSGNPVILLEIVKALYQQYGGSGKLPVALPIPDNVKAIFRLRLSNLSNQAMSLARCAAVAGQSFTTELAQAVLGISLLDLISPWHELEQAQILENRAMVHESLADAILADIPDTLLQLLHYEIASFLELQCETPKHLLVGHWQKAGRADRALPLMMAEADAANQSGRCLEEISWLEQMLPLLVEAGETGAFKLRYRLFWRYRLAKPLHLLADQVSALAELAEGEPELTWLAIAQTELALVEGDVERARLRADTALSTAHQLNDHSLIFEATKALARVLQQQECYDLALQEVDKVQSRLPITDQALGIDTALHYAMALLDADRFTESLLYTQHAQRMAAAQAMHSTSLQLSLVAGHAEFAMGDVSKALAHFRQADTLHSTHMVAPNIWQGHFSTYANILRQAGHYQQALAILELARTRTMAQNADLQALDCYALAQLYWQLGQPAKAKPLLEEARRLSGKSAYVEAQGLILQARLNMALSNQAKEDLLLRALTMLPDSGRRNLRIMALLALSEIPHRTDTYEDARQAHKIAQQHDLWGWQAASLAIMAREALKLQRREEATMHALSAVALLLNYVPGDIYPITIWREVYEVLQSQAYQAASDTALEYASRWLARVAACDVPLEYQDSFFHRNPDNKLFLHLARFRQAPTEMH